MVCSKSEKYAAFACPEGVFTENLLEHWTTTSESSFPIKLRTISELKRAVDSMLQFLVDENLQDMPTFAPATALKYSSCRKET